MEGSVLLDPGVFKVPCWQAASPPPPAPGPWYPTVCCFLSQDLQETFWGIYTPCGP